jgi:hypothetical protein
MKLFNIFVALAYGSSVVLAAPAKVCVPHKPLLLVHYLDFFNRPGDTSAGKQEGMSLSFSLTDSKLRNQKKLNRNFFKSGLINIRVLSIPMMKILMLPPPTSQCHFKELAAQKAQTSFQVQTLNVM